MKDCDPKAPVDIAIIAVPTMSPDRPAPAPAMLKAAAIEAGYSAVAMDLSIAFLHEQCKSDMALWGQLASGFGPNETSDDRAEAAVVAWLDASLRKIRKINPRTVGISVFSIMQHRASYRLARHLRQHCPDIKIVLGGFGLQVVSNSMSGEVGVRKIDTVKKFDQFMLDLGLCDRAVLGISGAGLDGLIDFLEQTLGPSNQVRQTYSNDGVLFNTPTPDYDDYYLDHYLWSRDPSLPVTGSKGCVRACTFCDIPGQFGRFGFRTGKDIAREMLDLNQRYGVRIFEFTDSLVNGSFKAFREWMIEVAAYNDDRPPDQQIGWFGQYICRPQRHTPDDIYDLMARSGVLNLTIGVESGSDRVLEAMKKKMTVQDVYDELEQFEKHGIRSQFLMFSGFYNETARDFEQTLEFIVRLQRWVAAGVISKISPGPPLNIFNSTALHDEADKLGIILDPYDHSNWTTTHDPDNDYVHRCLNRLIVQRLLDNMGVSVAYNCILNLHTMVQRLKQHEQELRAQLHGL